MAVDFWLEPVSPKMARAYAARWADEAESHRLRAEYAEGRVAYWTARASRSAAEGAQPETPGGRPGEGTQP